MTSCIRPSLVLDSLPELKVRSLPPVSPDFDGCLGSAFGNCRATAVGATAAAEAAAVFRNIRRSSPDILLSGLLCSTQTCSLTSASEERAQPSFAPAAGQPARVQNGCTRNPIQDHTAQADHAAAQRAPFRMSEPGECLHERSWLRKFHDAVQQQKQYGYGAQDASRPECLLRDRSDLRRLQQCCAFRSFPFHSRINRCLKSPFRTVFQHPRCLTPACGGSSASSGSRQMTTTATVPKLGQQRSRVPFSPPSPDFRQHFFATLLHVHDDSARGPRLLVPRPPDEQLQKDRRQINPLFRQPVVHSSSIRLLPLGGDDPRCFELLKTVRQDVGSNPLTRLFELPECPEPANHQIADDQKRPAIPKPLQRDTQRAPGTAR